MKSKSFKHDCAQVLPLAFKKPPLTGATSTGTVPDWGPTLIFNKNSLGLAKAQCFGIEEVQPKPTMT